jgi:nicotinamide riboside kinase
MSLVICLLGAESTGKTTLAAQLAQALNARGRHAVMVAEYLREFCEQVRRTPTPEEQAAIAAEQQRRIEQASLSHDVVVADTSGLMVSVYSELVFADRSLYPQTLAWQRGFGLTLLTAVDIPWVDDGLQRDGPHVREPVDDMIRLALHEANLPYSVVSGSGDARLENALKAFDRLTAERLADADPAARWRWACLDCDDGDCERHGWRLAQSQSTRGR